MDKVTDFLRVEQKALEAQLEKLKLRHAYVTELIMYAEVKEVKPVIKKDSTPYSVGGLEGVSLVHDMIALLQSLKGEYVPATEIAKALAPVWEKNKRISKGTYIKRIWGTMNYLRRKVPGVVSTRKGKIGYLAWGVK